jgi:integrase
LPKWKGKLKDNEDRVVALPKQVIPELKEYRLRSKGEYVIALECGQWKHGHQAEVLKDFCREIGIKEVTHHSLRSSFISLALQDGVATAHVKDNVGHSKLSTTDGYYNEAGIHLKGVMDRLRIKVPTGKAAEVVSLKKAK